MGTPACAQDNPDLRDQVQAWFDAEWEQSQNLPNLGDGSVRWRLEVHDLPAAAAIEKLRAEVAGHPDHPDGWMLQGYDRRLKNGPDVMLRRLWVRGDGNWRWNTDENDIYMDICRTSSHAWMLSALTLDIHPIAPTIPSEYDLKNNERTFWPELGRLMTGGFYSGFVSGVTPRSVHLDGTTWTVIAERRAAGHVVFALEYQGEWDARQGRGYVDHCLISSHSSRPEVVGERWEFEEWKIPVGWDAPVAHRARSYWSDGRLDRSLSFDGFEPGVSGDFEQVTALPRSDRNDPIRGATTFRRINDYTQGEWRKTGTSIAQPLPSPYPDTRGASTSPRSWSRWPGWLFAGSIATTFAVIWIRRRSCHS